MTMTMQANSENAPASRLRGRTWPIFRLAAPLIAFFFIQSGVSLASLAMLGRLGNASLASVGAAGAVYGTLIAILFGVDAAVQATISRIVGAGRSDEQGKVLVEALVLATPLGVLLAGALWIGAPAILSAMIANPAVASVGAGYARAAAPSLIFFAITIPINACWIGSSRPGRAFLVTAVLAPVQILATLMLVFGAGPVPGWGAAGAGWGMSVAALTGIGLQLFLATRADGPLARRPSGVDLGAIGRIAALGWPISLQQALLQIGLIVTFVIVSRLGVSAIAVVNVLISLFTVPIQMAVGLGTATATLVGQSLGRGDTAGARWWGWRTVTIGLAFLTPLGAIALAAPEWLLSPFLRDPATLVLAVTPTRILGLGIVADAAARILCFAIRGAGATRTGAAIPFIGQWLFMLPLAWWIAIGLRTGVLGLTSVQMFVALGELAVTALIWAGSSWASPRALGAPTPKT